MISHGQNRLARIQLVNWGTFHGSFDLPVPRAGLLLTGSSGSGKSSLLDAIAAVLVQPKWLQFNAAAQEGGVSDKSRSLVSYVRGAFKREADADSGEVATAYLRTGATWTGIALTFDNGLGAITTLARLLHIQRGTNSSDGLGSLFILAEEAVDLLALAPFAENGLESRRLSTSHPTWVVRTSYPDFAVRLQRRLGLASDQAQRLLHKTQSAKNLTSLDTLLREFMLDAPDSFSLVSQATEQFQELSAAHASVVDARKQAETLGPLRQRQAERSQLLQDSQRLAAESEHLEAVRITRQLERTAESAQKLAKSVEALEEEVVRAELSVAARLQDRDAALQVVNGLGGRELEALESEHELLAKRLDWVTKQRSRYTSISTACGLSLPDRQSGMQEFLRRIASAQEQATESKAEKEERHRLSGAHVDARRQAATLAAELKTLEEQRSTLDEGLIQLRDALIAETGVSKSRLPFAGELIEVLPDHSAWTGAIERVLRTFARTLLVPSDLYPHVSEFVDDTYLRLRLVYERVSAGSPDTRAVEDGRSLVNKVAVLPSEFTEWMSAQLTTRFDYACVGSVAELRAARRAVTRTGQIKHSEKRHEKDDRSAIDDRRRWVLGSSIAAKREALEADLAIAKEREDSALRDRDAADDSANARTQTLGHLSDLLALNWEDIDVEACVAALALNAQRAETVRLTNEGLDEAKVAFDRADTSYREEEKEARALRDKRANLSHSLSQLVERRTAWLAELDELPGVPADVANALARRFDSQSSQDPDASARGIRATLHNEQQGVTERLGASSRRVESVMQKYKENWPAQAADLATQVEYLPDYLTILDALQADRLPEFENRFFDLLQGQSRNNIGQLSQLLNNSRREIRERVDPINRSLRQTEFAPGQYLHVRVDDRRLPEVTLFLQTLAEITSGSLEDALGSELGPEAREQAERRFLVLRDLLRRLSSTEAADVRWRQQCLDTRLHVQFVAEARDVDGKAVDYFTGAGGLSGGERQKLVVFCLAAALRYQLAREGDTHPAYGLVVLDEAFDKTDPAFTRAGLDVFRTFGFQLLLATPLKMLQTLEDYVGGAALVVNDAGTGSRLEIMSFETNPVERIHATPQPVMETLV